MQASCEFGFLAKLPRPGCQKENIIIARALSPHVRYAVLVSLLLLAGLVASLFLPVSGVFGWREAPIRIGVFLPPEVLRDDKEMIARAIALERLAGERSVEVQLFSETPSAEALRQTYRIDAALGFLNNSSQPLARKLAEAGIPVLVAGATDPGFTTFTEGIYRMFPADDRVAELFSAYCFHVLGIRRVFVITDEDVSGKSFANSFGLEFGSRGPMFPMTYEANAPGASDVVAKLLATIPADSEADAVLVSTSESHALEIIQALDPLPAKVRILLQPSTSNSPDFGRRLAGLADMRREPGRVITGTSGIWSIMDVRETAPFNEIVRRTGREPPLGLVHLSEALDLVATLLRQLPEGERASGSFLRDQLNILQSIDTAALTRAGPIYFDPFRNRVRSITFGSFEPAGFEPLPVQWVRNQDILPFALEEDQHLGQFARIGGVTLREQSVIGFGIHLNEADNFDLVRGLISLDFFLWLRSPASLEDGGFVFANAENISPEYLRPLQSELIGNTRYKLYRIRGVFRQQLDVRRFPFDEQRVLVRFFNATHDAQQIIYAREPRRGAGEGISSLATAKLGLWDVRSWAISQDAVYMDSDLGDRRLAIWQQQRSYPGGLAELTIVRRGLPYVVKNLIPLIVLAAAVLVSLYFPATLMKERVTVPITCILSGAVLLLSINRGLPEVAYTTSIEKLFYWFFMGCFLSLCLALALELLRTKNRDNFILFIYRYGPWIYILIFFAALAQFLGLYSFA
jgi:branched-chain amino acid transport system substrate-binding protein